jgi:serine/threonine-protein phosphatase 6 regulatory ankyrin repeat subunit B
MRAPRLRDILWSMKRDAPHRYSQAHGLAALMLTAMACGFNGTLANAQSNDLFTAAGRGDLLAVNALLQKAGADVNDAKNTALGPTTALMEASSNGHLEVVQALLAAKPDVNATRGPNPSLKVQLGDGVTALGLASRNAHLNVVQALLAANADVNAGSVPALYYATAAGNLDIVKVLLAAKPDLDWRDRALGSTALMLALAPNDSVLRNQLPRTGRWDIAQLLVEAGANVNVMDKGGVTALMLVVQEDSPRSLAMVQALLAAHADVNGGCVCRTTAMLPLGSARHSGASGYTALGLAVSLGSVEVVQTLLDANAQRAANASIAVNAKQLGGNTPLTLASARGRSGVVRLLLAAKAELSAANDEGKTALMLALENDHPEVAELLRSAVAALPGSK